RDRPAPADPAVRRPLAAGRSDRLPRPPVGALSAAADIERTRMLDLVARRGTSPLSFLLRYEAPWRAHFVGDGAVCYLEARRAAVAWSDPLCDPAELAAV